MISELRTLVAVSGQIKRLEDHLGFPLFDRTGRSATLNDAGLRTIVRAGDIIARFDSLDGPDDDIASGLMQIGAIASAQSTVLARALVSFRLLYPKHHVRIVPGVSMNLLDISTAANWTWRSLSDLRSAFRRPSHGGR